MFNGHPSMKGGALARARCQVWPPVPIGMLALALLASAPALPAPVDQPAQPVQPAPVDQPVQPVQSGPSGQSAETTGTSEPDEPMCVAAVQAMRGEAAVLPPGNLTRAFAETYLAQAMVEAGNHEYDDCLEYVARAALEVRERRHGSAAPPVPAGPASPPMPVGAALPAPAGVPTP